MINRSTQTTRSIKDFAKRCVDPLDIFLSMASVCGTSIIEEFTIVYWPYCQHATAIGNCSSNLGKLAPFLVRQSEAMGHLWKLCSCMTRHRLQLQQSNRIVLAGLLILLKIIKSLIESPELLGTHFGGPVSYRRLGVRIRTAVRLLPSAVLTRLLPTPTSFSLKTSPGQVHHIPATSGITVSSRTATLKTS